MSSNGPRGRNGVCDFAVEDVTEAFRYFRIIAIGDGGVHDSSFSCSGIELYGGFKISDQPAAAPV